jgi:hypothetical protein
VALAFAVAALLASWSPLAAPFGLATGLGAVLLAVRARRQGGPAALAALALAALACSASAWVLVRTAGLGRGVGEAPEAPVATERETGRRLDEAAVPSRAARQGAERQLAPLPPAAPRN